MKYETVMGMRNITFNMCNLLGEKKESFLIGVFAKDIKKHTNLIHPCPFSVITKPYYIIIVGYVK